MTLTEAARQTARATGTKYLALRPEPSQPRPSTHDGFDAALASDRALLWATLQATDAAAAGHLEGLVSGFYDLLRSPLSPKKASVEVGEALLRTRRSTRREVWLYGVLASPTAAAEVPTYLRAAELFVVAGFRPRLTLLVVRWETLRTARGQAAAHRDAAYTRSVHAVAEACRRAGFPDAVEPLDLEVDVESGTINGPADATLWSHLVQDALTNPQAMPSLRRDVQWSTAFYARQTSLDWLGPEQALLDLAIRRIVGKHLSLRAQEAPEGSLTLMLTSELNKRFLPCYEATLPIANLALDSGTELEQYEESRPAVAPAMALSAGRA